MFPFINNTEKKTPQYQAFQQAEDRRISSRYGPAPTGEEREALEVQYRADYGSEYVEDRPVTRQEIKDCLARNR